MRPRRRRRKRADGMERPPTRFRLERLRLVTDAPGLWPVRLMGWGGCTRALLPSPEGKQDDAAMRGRLIVGLLHLAYLICRRLDMDQGELATHLEKYKRRKKLADRLLGKNVLVERAMKGVDRWQARVRRRLREQTVLLGRNVRTFRAIEDLVGHGKMFLVETLDAIATEAGQDAMRRVSDVLNRIEKIARARGKERGELGHFTCGAPPLPRRSDNDGQRTTDN